MSGDVLAQESGAVSLSIGNLTYVVVVAVIALIALAMASVFRREVLAASDGTPRMRAISAAVQEGASAYLNRQFRTLSIFVVLVFALLFALPGDMDIRIGRSIFFIVGALFLREHRLPGDVARDPRQRTRGRGGQRRRPRPGDAHRVPHRRHGGHGHCWSGSVGRRRRRVHLPR